MLRIAFRVDASVEIGLGHLTRCISLAGALASHGAKASFLIRDHAARFGSLVEAEGHDVHLLRTATGRQEPPEAAPLAHARWLPVSWREDMEQTSEAVDRIGPVDWLIVDHYALDARWERGLRAKVPRILAIDDIADRRHDCDILLDQNLSLEMETRYSGLLPETCTALLGPRFALLRPEFGQMRAQTDTRSGKVSRILVCFGGSDPSNQTAKALAAVARLPAIPSGIDVAIGMSHPHRDSVAALCRELPGAKLHHGARNMAELMAQADLAIGAGGVMCWERCCLGLPTVALHIAENQVNSLTALADREALIYLGSADAVGQTELVEAVAELMADAARTKRMGELAQRLVDGGGGRRVSAAIIG